jgi:hypothetical protein
MVQDQVTDTALRGGLVSTLAKSQSATQRAETALTGGNRRRTKAEIVNAIRSLKKFTARLGSRKAKRLIQGDVRTALQLKSGDIRRDLITLKGQLRK